MAIAISRWTELALPESLDALQREAVAEGHDWAVDLAPAWQARPFLGDGEALFLAHEGSALLAVAVISADPFVAGNRTGRLRFIYVRESARRRGIAERLVAQCLEAAKGKWDRLRLHTDNPLAARLYERHGFRPVQNATRATHVLDL